MHDLAGAERFEEAADMRDRAAALARALRRQRRLDGLARVDRLVVELPGQGGVELRRGRLAAAWGAEAGDGQLPLDLELAGGGGVGDDAGPAPVPRELADEVACIGGWLDQQAGRARLVACDGTWASPLPHLPELQAGRPAPEPPGDRARPAVTPAAALDLPRSPSRPSAAGRPPVPSTS